MIILLGKRERWFFHFRGYSYRLQYQCLIITGWASGNDCRCFYPVSAEVTFINIFPHVLPVNSFYEIEYKLRSIVNYCPIITANQWYFRLIINRKKVEE
jgi:hypothetical protein